MIYRVIIEKPAMKFLKKQNQEQRERILKAIKLLPGIGDIKTLAGHSNVYRLRIGDYRIIYKVEVDIITITVMKIGNRGDIYKSI